MRVPPQSATDMPFLQKEWQATRSGHQLVDQISLKHGAGAPQHRVSGAVVTPTRRCDENMYYQVPSNSPKDTKRKKEVPAPGRKRPVISTSAPPQNTRVRTSDKRSGVYVYLIDGHNPMNINSR
eukprot:TRINITY_DN3534_c0_g1_i26.p1 TRINITY_DN3534_c0_g1~~TRINITY_DN3534_c0_g1_i26.p1  ORF type:complete len:124 (-),score=8.55 TRINITY_DN3534_c0_g1_i26:92-463(-)